MAQELNRQGTKPTYKQSILTKNGLPIGFSRQGQTMPIEFINLNSSPVIAVTVTTEKLWGKKNDRERSLKNQQKMITESLGRKNDKVEIKFEIYKELECKQLLW